MFKRVCKRFTSLMLAVALILSFVPSFALRAFAATSGTVTGLSDGNLGLSYTHSGSVTDAWSASGTTITGSVVATAGTCGNTDYNSTLTIKNNKETSATLSFDYAVEVNSGTIQVDVTVVSAGGSYSKELAAGESINVYLASGSTTATKITMTNVALVADVTATTTFQPAENGSFTVDGNAITENYSSTQSSTQGYAVVATPASGYQFMGWYDVTNGKYISTEASTTLNMEYDATITAKFAAVGVALFDVGGQVFENLDEATTYATANSIAKVTLVSDGTLTGSYTIPEDVVLLIPFDDAKTLYTDTPVALYGGGGTRVAYKTLTLATGASLTVNGGISVGGRYNSASGSASGYMTGAYGLVKMESGSQITVKSGGALYAWGFVTGSGNVTVESGGTAYEWFQIADFRGGTATMNMSNKVFPFSQYYVQNVEVPLTLNAGATEIVYTGVYASSKVNNASITFVGDSGMFKVVSGSVTKVYDGASDRLRFTINGEMELNNLSLNLAGMNVNSANYVLPITNNVSLEIASGKLTVNQSTALLAGVDVTVDQGAELLVSSGASVYLYDQDEWTADSYVTGGKFKSVTYAPSKAYTRTEADLVDARIDVCGTMTAAGSVYTTTGGADICSSQGTGVYQQTSTPGTETVTYQYTQSGSTVTSHEINITPAKLHNADGSYTETANASAGEVINYVDGFWGDSPVTEFTITFDANEGEGNMDAQTVTASTDTVLRANTFTRDGYTFTGWNTVADGSGTPYGDEATVNLTEDLTLYAQWQHNDGWFETESGKTYYQNGELQKTGWTTIDGQTYYLNTETGYAAMNGIYWLPYPEGYGPDQWDVENNTNYTKLGYDKNSYFIFNAEGVFQNTVSGFYTVTADTKIVGGNAVAANTELTAWAVNGELPWHPGLVISNGAYYYFTTGYFENGNSYICGQDYSVSKPNDLAWPNEWGEGTFTVGKYTFDADGKLQLFDGFTDIGDETYYYVKGVKTYAGLIQIGDDYYYVNSSCKVIKGQSYTVSKTNGLLPAGTYDFDDDGKMIREDTTKNGIVKETEDTWYYYVNGVKTYAGLIEIDGDFYYVNSKLEVIHGRNYFISKTNGLMEQRTYYFDAEGKLVQPDAEKNGIVKESDDTWYYYVDGVKTYAGLIQIDGDYYYVNSSFKVIHNQSYYVSKTNGLKAQGTYEFDADGKMVIATDDTGGVKNGIVKETEDTWYYYVDGTKTYAGLIVIDGSYYYVNSKCEVIHGRQYFISKTNGLLANGTYTFDEDGKMNT